MRLRQRNTLLVLIMGLLVCLFVTVPREAAEGRAPDPVPQRHVLTGIIKLKGEPPDINALNERLLEEMKKKDTEYCLKCDDTEKTQQAYRLGRRDNRQVGNVFVWLVPDKPSFFPVSEKQLEEARKREVKVRQPHCAFIPHCLFLFSQYRPDPQNPRRMQPTGQALKIVNDAEISHNTNWTGGSRNAGGNVILASGTDRSVDNLVPESKEVPSSATSTPG
jgi:hypothetical protein